MDQQEKRIKTAATYRDAALFTAFRLGTWKQVSQEDMKAEHKEWIKYFMKVYFPENNISPKEEHKENPLNYL